ncbi:hypothetical protein QFC22_004566 [Naganishia vaughanmartiniae]|uniref:Uncharacterized protein n=1 Tax=Naganishia vaughanmartiniae TaxID=1424756 RepID=A0ACC2X0L4_9TREE|nr:hypothetical protein QFC22_004566 [Naganishia vaughanmartiniae]
MAQQIPSHSPLSEETTVAIPATDLARLQAYLSLPPTGQLPSSHSTPLAFLAAYIDLIPPSLTYLFYDSTTPQERSRIKQVKARRMIWAGLGPEQRGAAVNGGRTRNKKPDELTAEDGWKRFPLLWERLGGDPLGPPRSLYTDVRPGIEDGDDRIPRDRQRDELISILSANRPSHNETRARPKEKPKSESGQGGGGGGLFGAMDDDDEAEGSSMSSIPLPTSKPSSTQSENPSSTISAAALPPPPTSKSAHLESQWPSQSFMPTNPDRSSVLKVNKLGSLMRDLEEEREALEVVQARRRERRDMAAAERRGRERFGGSGMVGGDEEMDEHEVGRSQEEVVDAFERHLLELFLDGMDTIPYSSIDFTEPPDGNPLLEQDAQDDYFDDEEEFDYRSTRGSDRILDGEQAQDGDGAEGKLADGEYDY